MKTVKNKPKDMNFNTVTGFNPQVTDIRNKTDIFTDTTKKSTVARKLTHTQISERARIIWEKSGRKPGRDEQNWMEAERQLKKELGIS